MDVDSAILQAARQLGYRDMKSEQSRVIKEIVAGNDVFVAARLRECNLRLHLPRLPHSNVLGVVKPSHQTFPWNGLGIRLDWKRVETLARGCVPSRVDKRRLADW